PGLVHGGPCADHAAAARLLPCDRVGKTEWTHRSRRQVRFPAGRTCRKHQPMRAAALPERRGIGTDARTRLLVNHASLVRITLSPHAVPHCSALASLIWLAPAVPRSCRVISQIEFQPATCASDKSPPDVFTGNAPPGAMRPF